MKLTAARRVASQRCFHHAGREAVARCVVCRHSYCRECVAEHDGRMICAPCLRRETAATPRDGGRWLGAVSRAVQTVVALLVAWSCFYFLAQALLDLPSPVHEGSMWSDSWQETEKP